jgi:hypothetical protein
MQKAHLKEFQGSAHPPGQDDDYDGVFLTRSEIEQKAKSIVGTPIWYEHNGSKKVGWVRRGSVDEEGRLVVHGVVDRNSFAGVKAARELESGSLKGLSLGIDHLVMKDDERNFMKIASKAIEEVSVTADPDLPDTMISNVAPDSEAWKLQRQRVAQGLQKHKTKTQVMKNRAELQRLRKEASDRKISMSAPPAEQQQDASPAAAAPTTEGQGEVSEMDALRQKLDAQQKRMAELEAEKAQQEQEFAALQSAENMPDAKQKQIIAQHEARMASKRAEMAEEEAGIIDRITADIIASGEKPNPELIEMIKMGKDKPEGYNPLYRYVKSQAGAAAYKRATEAETLYQAEKQQNALKDAKIAELNERLAKSDTAQQQIQAQAQQQAEFAQRKLQYGQFVSGATDPTARKRARVDEEPEVAAASAVGTTTPSTDADVTFGMSAAPPGITFMPAGVQPAEVTGQSSMLEMFESVKSQRMQPSDTFQLLSTSGVRPTHRASHAAMQSLFDAR